MSASAKSKGRSLTAGVYAAATWAASSVALEATASGLPHAMPDGLHMIEPSAWPQRLAWLAALALAFWLWRRWRSRELPPAPAPIPPKPSEPSKPNVVDRIIEIRRHYRNTADFRAGSHELAATVRRHLESRLGDGGKARSLTALELIASYDEAVGRLMMRIADLQWRRRRPEKFEFDSACDLAIEVLALHRRATRRVDP